MTASGKNPVNQTAPQQAIVELRRYLLHPGQRETLIDLFDREFVETQEECGMSVLGQFRDLDRPDEFVWLRGFSDMETRRQALVAFYEGPVWAAHRDAANATMIDSDNVLLLRPADARAQLGLAGRSRPENPDRRKAEALQIFVVPLVPGRAADFPAYFAKTLAPPLAQVGTSVEARFVTEESRNTFPRLPVREGEQVFVWLARFADHESQVAFSASPVWLEAVATGFAGLATGAPSVLRLEPTARSLWK